MSARTKRPVPRTGPRTLGGSVEARKMATVILEALSGARSTQEAAEAMGVALTRYYVLETRALEGLIAGLEPRRRGRQPSPSEALERLKGEVSRLEREVSRYQALYRTAQRALGVPRLTSREKAPRKNGKTTRRRRKSTRGERVLSVLRPKEAEAAG